MKLKTALKAFGYWPTSDLDRRSAQKTIAFDICKRFNLRVYHQNVRWPEDEEFLTAMREFKPGYARIRDRNYSLYHLAKTAASLEGDTAECGVLAGDGSFIICRALNGAKRHHLFDSFEGLSDIQPEDVHERGDVKQYASGDVSLSEQKVRENLSVFTDRLAFHKGWIPERFPEVKDRQFAFVHVDVDLYEPTRDCLEFFYPRLVPGGMIVCDDYGMLSCPGAYKAVNDYCEKAGVHPAHLTCGQALIVKR